MRADGTGERKVYDHKGTDEFNPEFSPDGHRIAFSRLGLRTTEVWTVGSDGGGARRVTAGGNPTWLPARPSRAPAAAVATASGVGAGLIAFARTTGTGASALYVVRADGAGLRKISSEPLDFQPAWTPDGKRLVFASSRGGREGAPELYLRDLAERAVVRLTRTPHSDADWAGNVEPSVRPDGARVVFVREIYRDRKWSRDLYSVALVGGPVRRLTRTTALESSPTIGRSGALYFERGGWIYETGLGKTRRIARGVHPAKDPSVRGLVAFAYAGGIYVTRGGRPELVAAAAENGGLSQPAWSSDGERLVYVAPDGLFTVNVDGSDVRRLTRTSTLVHDVAPAWQPFQRS
jgi:Tol biopolymer transport system component